jgi:hypothetical protein
MEAQAGKFFFLANRKSSSKGFGMPHIEAARLIKEDGQTSEDRSGGK